MRCKHLIRPTDRSQTCKPSAVATQAQLVLASELGRCSRRVGRLVAGRGNDPLTLIKDGGNMATFAADFLPPISARVAGLPHRNGRHAANRRLGHRAGGVVISIPFGLMSAENLVPWWVYQPVRRLMDACRAINEMVFAMLFVVAVGLGPFAGVLALFIHTTGVLCQAAF